eukprot:5614407-Pyramimonas_sp.AAC.1
MPPRATWLTPGAPLGGTGGRAAAGVVPGGVPPRAREGGVHFERGVVHERAVGGGEAVSQGEARRPHPRPRQVRRPPAGAALNSPARWLNSPAWLLNSPCGCSLQFTRFSHRPHSTPV